MIYVQKVSTTYRGKDIATFPAHYPWWRRLWAFLTQEHLPKEKLTDVVTMHFMIQGPDPEFVEKEADYRIQHNLKRYKLFSQGDVEIVNTTRGAIFEHHGTRPLRDYSPSKSRDFDAWVASFS